MPRPARVGRLPKLPLLHGHTWHWEQTLPLNSHTDPRTMLGAQQECTIQFTAPASRALRASRWQRGMMVKPLQFINYAKAINALSKQLLTFGQPGPGAAPALSQRGWAPGEDPLSSRVNGSILWTSWMKGKKEREDGRALSPALGLFICAAPIHVCVCVCAGHTLHWHILHPSDSLCAGVMPEREKKMFVAQGGNRIRATARCPPA